MSRIVLEERELSQAGRLAAIIWLNRPDHLNAVDAEMLEELSLAIDRVEANAAIRVLFVSGRGRAFSAGGDLKKYVELQTDAVAFPRFVERLHEAFGRLRGLSVPVVALVNGVTAAGGLELLLNCDFALAARSARIGDAHLNFGQMGGGGVLTLLPRRVGLARATELILGGHLLAAHEAVEWGLVSRAVEDDELVAEGMRFAESVAEKSPLAVRHAKQVMNAIWAEGMTVSAGSALERSVNAAYCLTSVDAPEGLAAFGEKRTPRFVGR